MEKLSMTSEQMRRAVARRLRDAGVDRGALVLAAVSGGRDSSCLMHMLRAVSLQCGFSLAVAHVCHGVRAQTAMRDACFVHTLCRRLDVPCYVRDVDAPALAAREGLSLEDACRRLRYAALADIARACGAFCIVTAHQADDQLETMLMGIARGSAALLCGMAQVSCDARGRIVRPLLDFSRAQIDFYAAQNGVLCVRDETNADSRYLRNDIRAHVVPLLRARNGALAEGAAALARQMQAGQALLKEACRDAFARFVREDARGMCILPGVANLSQAVALGALKEALTRFGCRAGERTLFCVLALFEKQCGRRVDLSGGAQALRTRDGVLLLKKSEDAKSEIVPLAVPGVTQTPWGVFRVTGPAHCAHAATPPQRQWFPAAVAEAGLFARTARAGERMRPMGLGGSRLLSDVLSEAGFDAVSRATQPLVANACGALWAVGVRADESLFLKEGQPAYLFEFEAR